MTGDSDRDIAATATAAAELADADGKLVDQDRHKPAGGNRADASDVAEAATLAARLRLN